MKADGSWRRISAILLRYFLDVVNATLGQTQDLQKFYLSKCPCQLKYSNEMHHLTVYVGV
jgi:hypothetical protein